MIERNIVKKGRGRMDKKMIRLHRKEGYERTSLSVDKQNYAVGMYKKVGLVISA